jgi:hypothetical protein
VLKKNDFVIEIMIVSSRKTVTETADMMCNVIDVQYQLCLAKDQQNMTPSTPVFDSISTEISRFESVRAFFFFTGFLNFQDLLSVS